MRHRPVWFRLLTCLWALWFSGAVADIPAFQTCPMHAMHSMHGAQAAGMSMPVSASTGSGSETNHQQPGHSSGSCTCLGACCCAPATILPITAVAEVPAPRSVVESRVEALDVEIRPASAPRYTHPFAIGPPSRLA